LEKIKRERLEQKEKEVLSLVLHSRMLANASKERERAAQEQEQREYEIARGNPLLNPQDFNMKRRWDDDVVFKNQARGTEEKKSKEFINV
jgi:protein CWC15